MRNLTVRRMQIVTNIMVTVAVLQFIYTNYKYFFYSADCNPRNEMSLQFNSFLNMLGLASDFIIWLIPVTVFFWPTAQLKKHERAYRRTKKRLSELSKSTESNISSLNKGTIYSDSDSDSDSDSEDEDGLEIRKPQFGIDAEDIDKDVVDQYSKNRTLLVSSQSRMGNAE